MDLIQLYLKHVVKENLLSNSKSNASLVWVTKYYQRNLGFVNLVSKMKILDYVFNLFSFHNFLEYSNIFSSIYFFFSSIYFVGLKEKKITNCHMMVLIEKINQDFQNINWNDNFLKWFLIGLIVIVLLYILDI